MTHPINLIEWETLGPAPGSPLHGRFLTGNREAQRLAGILTEEGRIEILELARGLELRASSFVGRFALGDFMITIRPKISGMPLMNLIRYAYRLRDLNLFTEVSYTTSSSSFEDLLIHQLAAEASELLARGLHRDYVHTESMLSSPRGRIAFGKYVQVAGQASVTLPCVHHPRSENARVNRALQGGLEFSARLTLDRDLRGRLRRLARSFAPEITRRRLNAGELEEALNLLDRRTSAYEPALKLVQILMRAEGADLFSSADDVPAGGFLFDMNRFFQALLLRFLSDYLAGYEVQDETIVRGLFTYDPANNPHRRLPPKLRPDFLVLRNNRAVAVLDAKYRDLWERNLPREMLYQLALYALGQNAGERRATILYPTLEDAARQQIILVKEPLRGTGQAQVILRPVNLLKLEGLLQCTDVHAHGKRMAYAQELTFGTPEPTTLSFCGVVVRAKPDSVSAKPDSVLAKTEFGLDSADRAIH